MKKVMIMGLVIALVVCFAVPSMAQEEEVSPFTTTATGSVELKYSDGEAAAPSGYFQGSVSAAFTGQLKATIEDKVEAVIKFKISPQALANTDLTYADAKSPYGIAVAVMGWYGDEWEDLKLEEIADWNAVIEGIDLTGYFTAGDLDATKVVTYTDSADFDWVVWIKIWELYVTDEEKGYIADVAYERFSVSEIMAAAPTGTDITLADIVSDASIKLIGVGGIADITAYPLGKTISVGSMVTSENTTQSDPQPALAFDAAGIMMPPELTVNVVVNQEAGAAAVEDDLETATDETAATAEPVLGYSVGGTYALGEVLLGGKFAGLGADNSVYSVNLAYSPTADGFSYAMGGEYTGAGDAGAGYGLDVSVSPFEDLSLGVKYLGKNTAFGAVVDAEPGDQNTVAAMFSHTAGDINATFVTLGYTMDAISFNGHYATGVDTDEYGLSVNTDIASIEGLKVGGSYGYFSEIEDTAYSINATYTIATNTTLTATYGNSFDVRDVKTGYSVGLKVTF